jgi:hypothetical protein
VPPRIHGHNVFELHKCHGQYTGRL